VLSRHAGESFLATEKLDGTSMAVYWRHGRFGVCSRNYEMRETAESTHWQAARQLGLEERVAVLANLLGGEVAVQGELCGPRIQGNNCARWVNSLLNLVTCRRRRADARGLRAADRRGIGTVPVLPPHPARTVAELVRPPPASRSRGHGGRPRVPPSDGGMGRGTGPLSFKVINPEFRSRTGRRRRTETRAGER
jgi:hypothetical protein